MDDAKELIMYGRSYGCPYQSIAQRVLNKYDIPHRTIYIDQDDEALKRVIAWTGFKSVPTMVIANPGEDTPHSDPTPISGTPRGKDRGPMITEATRRELITWLIKNDFLDEDVAAG